MDLNTILAQLPYDKPFLFVDTLEYVNESGAKGSYVFKEDLDFYRGHFKDKPITPGVILTECCAQIGVVSLGIFLAKTKNAANAQIALSSSTMEYYLPVFPKEKVVVISEKQYFRFGKLKCLVKMYNDQGKVICSGTIAGMLKPVVHA